MQYEHVIDWVLRIVRLDYTPFDEARRDSTATLPIIVLVVVLSFISGLGSFLWGTMNVDGIDTGDLFIESFLLGSALQVGFWFAWVFVTYILLTQVFHATADLNQMLRTMGLALLPLAIALLMFIPVLDFAIGLMSIVAAVVLVNTALQDTTTATPPQAMVANLGGFAVLALGLTLLSSDTNTYAPGFFAMDFAKDTLLSVTDFMAGFSDVA